MHSWTPAHLHAKHLNVDFSIFLRQSSDYQCQLASPRSLPLMPITASHFRCPSCSSLQCPNCLAFCLLNPSSSGASEVEFIWLHHWSPLSLLSPTSLQPLVADDLRDSFTINSIRMNATFGGGSSITKWITGSILGLPIPGLPCCQFFLCWTLAMYPWSYPYPCLYFLWNLDFWAFLSPAHHWLESFQCSYFNILISAFHRSQ